MMVFPAREAQMSENDFGKIPGLNGDGDMAGPAALDINVSAGIKQPQKRRF